MTASSDSLGSNQDQLIVSVSTIVQLITEVAQKSDRNQGALALSDMVRGQSHDDTGGGHSDMQTNEEAQATHLEAHVGEPNELDAGPTDSLAHGTTSILEMEVSTQRDEHIALDGSAELQQDSEMEQSETEHQEEQDVQPQTLNQVECNKLDADIEVCDYCEIPHHFDCLIQEPNGGTNRYCNACMDFHYGTQKGVSQSSSANSDLELSEPELSSNEDSATSEFVSTTRVVPKSSTGKASQSQPSTSKYKLRERKTK